LRCARPGFRGLDFTVTRWRRSHQRVDEPTRVGCDLLHGPIERGLVRLRRLREAADLADKLQRGIADFLVGHRRSEVEQRTNVAAHEIRLTSRVMRNWNRTLLVAVLSTACGCAAATAQTTDAGYWDTLTPSMASVARTMHANVRRNLAEAAANMPESEY